MMVPASEHAPRPKRRVFMTKLNSELEKIFNPGQGNREIDRVLRSLRADQLRQSAKPLELSKRGYPKGGRPKYKQSKPSVVQQFNLEATTAELLTTIHVADWNFCQSAESPILSESPIEVESTEETKKHTTHAGQFTKRHTFKIAGLEVKELREIDFKKPIFKSRKPRKKYTPLSAD